MFRFRFYLQFYWKIIPLFGQLISVPCQDKISGGSSNKYTGQLYRSNGKGGWCADVLGSEGVLPSQFSVCLCCLVTRKAVLPLLYTLAVVTKWMKSV